MYEFTFTVKQDGVILDEIKVNFCVRSIELVREQDTQSLSGHPKGRSFYFKLNSIPIYAKGGNYVPRNVFQPNLTRHPEIYEQTLMSAKLANYNMIRLWGGGWYETDIFYQLCDKLGIMVWHDFPFANSLYPADYDMLSNIIAETRDNLRRIRNHPAVVFFNGNNEIQQGLDQWGWSGMNQGPNGQLVRGWYSKIFDTILPGMLELECQDRSYVPSSPMVNYGQESQGNVHYWMVFWGQADFLAYEGTLGRFNSEYGMQSMTHMSSIRQFNGDADMTMHSSVTMFHNKHGSG